MIEDFNTLKVRCEMGYNEFTGIHLEVCEKGHAEGYIEIEEHHLNPYGTVHGGMIFTMADTIGGFALRSKGTFPTTVSSSINYLKAVSGKRMYAVADVISAGRKIGVSEVKILNDEKIECARAQMTYYNLEIKE